MHLSPNALKSMKKEFGFITQNPLLKPSKRKKGGFITAGSDQADVETTIKNLKLQSRLIDFGINQDNNQAIQESLSPSQLSNSRLMSQEEFVQRYKDMRRSKQEPVRSMTKNELRDQAHRRQKQFDQKVLDKNKMSPLDKHWTSPFTQTPNRLYVSSSVKSILSGSDSVRQSLYDRTQKNYMSTHMTDHQDYIDNQMDDNIIIKDLQLNQIVKGYGPFLKTILDKNKQESFNYNHDIGNPKFLYHAEKLQRLKKMPTGRLDMIKEWNQLLKREQLKPKPQQTKPQKQILSTLSKCQTTQFQTFLDTQSKRTIPSQQLAGQRNHSRIRATPLSQISPLPQLIVRNGSNSSSRKELKQFGFLKQSNELAFDENSFNSDSFISKDVFLTDCPTFWSIIRKEDEIVERLCVCLMNKQNLMSFLKFQLFYQIFIFAEKSPDEVNDFIANFLMKDIDQTAIVPFQDIVALIELLCIRIDQQLVKIQQKRLADRIYDRIIERIGVPQQINHQTIKSLVHEQVIPAQLILRLIYDC